MLRPTPKSALFTFASLVRCNVVLREGSTPCTMVLQSRCEVIFGYHMDLTNGYLGNQKLEYRKFPIQSYGPLNLLLKGSWNVVLREGSTPCAMVLQSRREVIFRYHMDLTNGYLGKQKLEYRKFPFLFLMIRRSPRYTFCPFASL